MGRHHRGRAAWEEMTRVEEVESTDEDEEYLRETRRRQLEYGDRRRRRPEYEELTDSESVDGGDYDLYDHGDSTVAYAVQLAMRNKEDQLVEKALERIRRAQMLGKKNVRLSQRELEALERKRLQTDSASGRRQNQINNQVGRSGSRRNAAGEQLGAYPPFPSGAHRTGAAHGHPSSSSVPRPRTPTAHSLRPQQSSSPLRPSYPPFPSNFSSTGRPQSMPQPPTMFPRPLPDDPQWAPAYYPTPINPYGADPPAYPPQIPPDHWGGPYNRVSYPSGLPPFPAHHRPFMDGRSRATRPGPSETESDSGSEDEEEEQEEETESSEGDDDVQIVGEMERQNPTVQRRGGSGRYVRGRAGR